MIRIRSWKNISQLLIATKNKFNKRLATSFNVARDCEGYFDQVIS